MLDRPVEAWMPMAHRIARSMARKHHAPADSVLDDAIMGLAVAATAPKLYSSPSTHIKRHIQKGMRDKPRQAGPPTVDIDEFFHLEDHAAGVSELAFHRELWTQVGKLPPEQSRPIQLVYKWGFSQDEAASMLGVPQRTLSDRIRKGIQTLNQRLA